MLQEPPSLSTSLRQKLLKNISAVREQNEGKQTILAAKQQVGLDKSTQSSEQKQELPAQTAESGVTQLIES